MKIPINTFLLASMVDHLAFMSWAETKDAQKGKNKPKSILKILLGEENTSSQDKQVFSSFDDFLMAWNED